ncbi:hydroxymethylglutaryl-CoA reductase, degradative [Ignisphaera sp. 4213-co]|uniref:3-hydroxy-3-methylglutaryl coenzyme A reductase n=1 Tax=Ignisphaera cupida TaxID=3050454 RepID=A0ABD4Z5I0_9CREN|nr:hydroxymethylglutaryl-CoA reductase, degradative [Ignisphaera sp. 4213-co]MDK6028257.1 hydroxymethylglutaryl-CoA reductase, degradative [Ignisphaera sp. 4213-co]
MNSNNSIGSSRIPGFYKLSIDERLNIVINWANLNMNEVELLKNFGNLNPKVADTMIENVIGAISYPFAVATNFRINGKEYLVPMVIEEPSVVAAASNAARMLREANNGDGIRAEASKQLMIGQVHLVKVPSPHYAAMEIMQRKNEILEIANSTNKTLVNVGGGAKDIEVRVIETRKGPVVVVHLIVDVVDAMGANTINTMAEAVAPYLEKLSGGEARLRIVSNYAVYRIARAWVRIEPEKIGGMEVAEKIVEASAIAEADIYRAVTHNKGIMNGVIAIALATAQDHRAIEAGAHAYAARDGRYKPLSTWDLDSQGYLVGVLEMPLQVGTIGGAVKTHPVAQIALKILGIKTAKELAEIMVAVGLAQNFAALRALVTTGIQAGHMKLHARNLAISAGAEGALIDIVAEEMIKEGKITFDKAKELVEKYKASKTS